MLALSARALLTGHTLKSGFSVFGGVFWKFFCLKSEFRSLSDPPPPPLVRWVGVLLFLLSLLLRLHVECGCLVLHVWLIRFYWWTSNHVIETIKQLWLLDSYCFHFLFSFRKYLSALLLIQIIDLQTSDLLHAFKIKGPNVVCSPAKNCSDFLSEASAGAFNQIRWLSWINACHIKDEAQNATVSNFSSWYGLC